jgi:hypothetical protein
VKFEIKSGSSYLANDRARYRYNPLGMRALVERDANTTDTSHSINERRYLYFKSGCEQQPSPNARETRPPDPNHEGASFAFCAAFSRGGPGRLVRRCLGVLTTGSPGSPAGRPDGPKVSPGLSRSRVLG